MTKKKGLFSNKVYVSRSSVNSILGGLYMTIGFLSFGMAGWVASRPLIPTMDAVSVAPAQASCAYVLNNLGFTVSKSETNAELKATDVVNSIVMDQLSRASLAIEACEGYKLKEFCAGAECGSVALSLTLVPNLR